MAKCFVNKKNSLNLYLVGNEHLGLVMEHKTIEVSLDQHNLADTTNSVSRTTGHLFKMFYINIQGLVNKLGNLDMVVKRVVIL